jgi:hypothetical protein
MAAIARERNQIRHNENIGGTQSAPYGRGSVCRGSLIEAARVDRRRVSLDLELGQPARAILARYEGFAEMRPHVELPRSFGLSVTPIHHKRVYSINGIHV